MSDHELGLAGLVLGLLSIIAPFRWPKMPRWLSDVVFLIAGTLMAIAILPHLAPEKPIALPVAAPPMVAQSPRPQPTRSVADQKKLDSLDAQLKSTQAELADTSAKLNDARNEARTPYSCLTGDRLIYMFHRLQNESSANAEATVKQAADSLDICIQNSGKSTEQLKNELLKDLDQKKF